MMCLAAVHKVIQDPRLLRLFHIPSDLWPAMRKSYGMVFDQSKPNNYRVDGKAQFDLMGRFDWSWDGKNPPKLLEYNADTPSLLLESSVIQGDWYKDTFSRYAGNSQANFIDKALRKAMSRILN